eukprot:2707591-Rhodomonas_salina.1
MYQCQRWVPGYPGTRYPLSRSCSIRAFEHKDSQIRSSTSGTCFKIPLSSSHTRPFRSSTWVPTRVPVPGYLGSGSTVRAYAH